VNNALVTKERGSLSEPSVVALRAVKEAIRLLGSCTKFTFRKISYMQASMPILYALFPENQCKQALLEEEEKKKRRLKRLRELIRGPGSICTSSWLNRHN